MRTGRSAMSIPSSKSACCRAVFLLVAGAACQTLAQTNETPPAPPAWVAGYGVRYTLRITTDLAKPSKTVLASLPTGGWLKPDASDLVVKTATGEQLPVMVLSHSPLGDTIIQFKRQGDSRHYWVYAANPSAPPRDEAFLRKVEGARLASEQAVLYKMAAMKTSAAQAAEHRDVSAELQRQAATVAQAAKELTEWDTVLPQRVAVAAAAAPKVPPAQVAAKQAAEAHAPLQKVSDDESALARVAAKAATAADRAAAAAATTVEDAVKQSKAAAENVKLATAAAAEAVKAATTAPPEKKVAADQVAAHKTEVLTLAKASVLSKAQAVRDAQAAKATADQKAAAARATANAADAKAKAARLAAAPTTAAKLKADSDLATLTAASNAAAAAVTEAHKRIAAVKAIKLAAEKLVTTLTPKVESLRVAAENARKAADDSVSDAAAKSDAYFNLAADADPRLLKEGLTLEVRKWEGDNLADWPSVVEGLQRSDTIVDNAPVGEVNHNEKALRRDNARNYSLSYRGYLKVDKPGVYSFCINSYDASFLFINGYRVYSRTGAGKPLHGRAPLYSFGADIQIEVGVHPFEIHNIVGNTSDATGYCKLIWLKPGDTVWSYVPRESFSPSLTAIPVQVEGPDGRQAAIFNFGCDDALTSDGLTLYLCRFDAVGRIAQPNLLQWDFGDGSTQKGIAAQHLFNRPGDTTVSLKSHPALPAFRRLCHIEVPPVPTSPLSLDTAVGVIGDTNPAKLATPVLNDYYHFLQVCDQPSRWPVIEKVCLNLLARKGLDVRYRVLLNISLMEAIARQGRGAEALKLVDRALEEAGSIRTLRALVLLRVADIHRECLRDFSAADAMYVRVISENLRLRHPVVRWASVARGDMYTEVGDLARAGEAYRMAHSLGSVGAGGQADDDPVKRGALLRVAEQQLKQGDARQTGRMLRRIETEFPEQKLEGLYRFLIGESERTAGFYDNAIRHYEMLMQLRQWSSYRPHALYGITDSYYRMGDFGKALEWLAVLNDSFPAFLEQQGRKAYPADLEARQALMSASTNAPAIPPFSAGEEGFDAVPEDADWTFSRSLGFTGPAAFQVPAATTDTSLPPLNLMNVPPQGSLWVEFWYRDILGLPGMGQHRAVTMRLHQQSGAVEQTESLTPTRTFGAWRKCRFRFPRPSTPNGTLTVSARHLGELFEIDGLRVTHVSDRQENVLRNFIEGADPQ